MDKKIKKILEDGYRYLFLKKNKFMIYKIKKNIKSILKNKILYRQFINSISIIKEEIYLDFKAMYEADPAANSIEEIIICYPGAYAIYVYRFANYLYLKNMRIIARIMCEYAHSKTGIDIHPGAKIGKYFCIDHGTGIVIGETTIIGDYVKLYQGVTLGAISLKNVEKLRGEKRHPTIMNNVTIYSCACILGGETIIGNNVVVGSNAFIVSSISDNSLVIPIRQGIEIKELIDSN